MEVNVDSHKDLMISHLEIRNRPPPKLRVMALNLGAVHDAQTGGHEIAAVTGVMLHDVPCDYDMSEKEWNRNLQHFHSLAKHKKLPWPPGTPLYLFSPLSKQTCHLI